MFKLKLMAVNIQKNDLLEGLAEVWFCPAEEVAVVGLTDVDDLAVDGLVVFFNDVVLVDNVFVVVVVVVVMKGVVVKSGVVKSVVKSGDVEQASCWKTNRYLFLPIPSLKTISNEVNDQNSTEEDP